MQHTRFSTNFPPSVSHTLSPWIHRTLSTLAIAVVVISWSCSATIPPPETSADREIFKVAMTFPTTFLTPKTEAEPAWSRARTFISTYSDARLKSDANNVMETENPDKAGTFGYVINRGVGQDSTWTFAVRCLTFNGSIAADSAKASQNAHMAAYYLSSGKISARYISRQDK